MKVLIDGQVDARSLERFLMKSFGGCAITVAEDGATPKSVCLVLRSAEIDENGFLTLSGEDPGIGMEAAIAVKLSDHSADWSDGLVITLH